MAVTMENIKDFVSLDSKVYEKMPIREVAKTYNKARKLAGGSDLDTLREFKNKISRDLYAYKDSNGRWRAGRLAKQNKGQFISGASARSLRGNATKQAEKFEQALTIYKRSDKVDSIDKALSKSYELRKRYRENKKLNPNVDKQVIYGNTVQDLFGNDWTQS